MVGQKLQNVAIKLLRLRQPPSTMMTDGRLELGLKLSGLWMDCHRQCSPPSGKFTRTELKIMINLWALNWKSAFQPAPMGSGNSPRGTPGPQCAFGPL